MELKKSVVRKDRSLGDEVLGYLVEHPEAMDSVEGIAEWWLLERRTQSAIASVEAALWKLVRRGFLEVRRCSDGRNYFRLNRAKEREIRRHLRKPGGHSQ